MKNAPIVEKRNLILFFAAVLVVLLGLMAFVTQNQLKKPIPAVEKEIQEIQDVSAGESLDEIENDLNDTSIADLDKELDDIEKELDSAY